MYLIGLALRLELLYGVVKPGLDHPPPRCGDGDLESDMLPCVSPGVGGTAGSGWANRLEDWPGASNVVDELGCMSRSVMCAFATEERRRRCEEAGGGLLEEASLTDDRSRYRFSRGFGGRHR